MAEFLKVAFVGSHGVGKTTLVEGLKNSLHLGVHNVVEETATKVFELSKVDPTVKINQDSNMEGQLHIMGFQIQDENRKAKVLKTEYAGETDNKYAGILFCDRAVTDAIVYTNMRTHRGDRYQWARNIAPYLFDWAVDSLESPYDLVFYIPISFPLESSDIRPGDVDFQEDIDALMQDVYIRHKLNDKDISYKMRQVINKMTILSGAVERRMSIAQSHIDEELARKAEAALQKKAYQSLVKTHYK